MKNISEMSLKEIRIEIAEIKIAMRKYPNAKASIYQVDGYLQ